MGDVFSTCLTLDICINFSPRMIETEAILYIGLSQSLFAAFTLATRQKVSPAQWVLVGCLLTIALKFILFLLNSWNPTGFSIEFSHSLTPLTFGPFLYLYSTYLIGDRARFNWKDLYHFIPFFLVSASYFLFFREVDFSEVSYLQKDPHLGIRVIFAIILLCSIWTYIILIFLKLRGFRKNLTSEFSYQSWKVRLLWLNVIAILFSGTFILYYILGLVNAINGASIFPITNIAHFGLTMLAFAVSYFGLRQPSLFRNIYYKEVPAVQAPTPKPPQVEETAHKFQKEEAAQLISRLDLHMENEKPYLNSELTLQDLSSQINLSKYELTELLNVHIGKNFFSYVNDYRVNAVKRYLQNPNYDHLTIISIAYDCGFNSKSTFNSIFKQSLECTPSEFRKNRG